MNTNFNLSPNIEKALEMLQYTTLTDVQTAVIPLVLEGRDVIVKSQTGSGKTASFVIPICEKLNWDDNAVQALILTPTRELALQVQEDVFQIGRFKRIKSVALYGRDPIDKQTRDLKQKTHIAVGTPGRVMDHLCRGTLQTDNIKYLVIDEADEMLNMGFIEQVEDIIRKLPKNPITILLSATMSDPIAKVAQRYLRNPAMVEIAKKIETKNPVQQLFYWGKEESKLELLRDITVCENPDSCMVFCNTQVAVGEVTQYLRRYQYSCACIHGGMEQVDRTTVMQNFRRGKFRYLIATDVAARGIDVDDISLVINYDMPQKCETYVHRIGRTGRIGKGGKAVTIVTNRGMQSLEELRSFFGKDMAFTPVPTPEAVAAAQGAFEEKSKVKQAPKVDKGAKLSEDILKLHINAGKKTKMRPVDIVGTLCSLEYMTADDIGIINVMDVSTFVEVLNGKGKRAMSDLRKKPIKGRLRTISVADDSHPRSAYRR